MVKWWPLINSCVFFGRINHVLGVYNGFFPSNEALFHGIRFLRQ
jgi:hypothetical protein